MNYNEWLYTKSQLPRLSGSVSSKKVGERGKGEKEKKGKREKGKKGKREKRKRVKWGKWERGKAQEGTVSLTPFLLSCQVFKKLQWRVNSAFRLNLQIQLSGSAFRFSF